MRDVRLAVGAPLGARHRSDAVAHDHTVRVAVDQAIKAAARLDEVVEHDVGLVRDLDIPRHVRLAHLDAGLVAVEPEDLSGNLTLADERQRVFVVRRPREVTQHVVLAAGHAGVAFAQARFPEHPSHLVVERLHRRHVAVAKPGHAVNERRRLLARHPGPRHDLEGGMEWNALGHGLA